MSATVLSPGLLSLLVDGGRYGHRAIGVGTSGPMDPFAFEVGNYLAGNETLLPSIEFFHPGPEITFHESALIAVTGVGIAMTLDGIDVLPWRPLEVRKNSTLRLIPMGKGTCGYIAILGGWESEYWLGSRSTSLAIGTGGFQGRALKKEDTLFFKPAPGGKEGQHLNWHLAESEITEVYSDQKHISCVKGPESDWLEANLLDQFVSERFRITPRSNRMGYRLAGEPLRSSKKIEMISSAVDLGTIQLLPDGQLVVLMADHQTTGGYPRLAAVAHSDIPRLTQFGRQSDLCFSWCSIDTACTLHEERKQRVKELKNSCLLRLKSYLH